VTQPDEVWLCEGADLFCEHLADKNDLLWRAKDEKVDAPLRQWMSEPLEQRKGMVGRSGASNCLHMSWLAVGGRVAATLVPVQVHANARSHETMLGSRAPRRKLHSHAGYNDLVPDQHGGKILPNFSSILIVNKWSVMFPRNTTTFHSDGLVN